MSTTIHELFQKHHLRCTAQRTAIYEALRMAHNHPTADELYRAVAAHSGSRTHLSRATVYNTLDALCKAGLVRQVSTASNGSTRYDADLSDHVHFRARDTSEIRDVPEHLGDQLIRHVPQQVIAEIERTMGVCIDGLSIHLIGRADSASN